MYIQFAEALHGTFISLSALAFNMVLIVVLKLLAGEERKDKDTFGKVTRVVFVGNSLSIVAYLVRHVDFLNLPDWLALLIYFFSLYFNILLLYSFSKYIERYFSETSSPFPVMKVINNIILVLSEISLVICYFILLRGLDGTYDSMALGGVPNFILTYCVELYYMLYAMVYFIRRSSTLNKRALITGIGAFGITLAGTFVEIMVTSNVLFNYFTAVLGLYIFYFGAEAPDYRKLKKTLEELSEEKRRADEANNSKSEFLANMSHEIRTPINAVLGMNEMILRETDNNNIKTYAHNIESAGNNLLSIINDILDFSKIEAGKLEIVNAPYKLSSVLNDVYNMTAFKIKAKGLEIKGDIDHTLPDGLIGDEVRIRRVFINLINNAIKYTKEGSIGVSVKGVKNGSQLLLKVAISDTGIGIKEEDLPNLFGRFNRLDLSLNNTIEGTGLGLPITRSLLEMMGGSIEVDSKYGVGSTFSFTIPQEIVSEEPIGNFREKHWEEIQEREEYRESFKAPDAEILVVDDTVINITVVQGLLKKTQIKIDYETGAAGALERTREKKYDLIFMDQRMPVMGGSEALKVMRKQEGDLNKETPVICLTADAVIGARERYIADGFTDYLTKPLNGDKLEEMLVKYLPKDKVIKMNEFENASTQTGTDTTQWTTVTEAYKNDPELDMDKALENTVTMDLLEDVLHDYWDGIETDASEIEGLAASGDYKLYTVKVHALKSSSRIVGIMGLGDMAYELELAGYEAEKGDEEAIKKIKEKTPAVLEKYRSYRNKLAPIFEGK
ncbi:MAG: response regulator [Lachnospiraceae bacterium]|nr:response regulator [Lachnospiraceae bacterium]